MFRTNQEQICKAGLRNPHGLEPNAPPIHLGLNREAAILIGEIAAQAGVSVQTVRLYERRGLMRRAARSASNYRHYEPVDLDILRTIAQCQRFGFTLAEIRQILSLFWVPDPRTGKPRHKPNETRCMVDACELGERKLADLDRRIADCTRARMELAQAITVMRGRIRERKAA